MSYLISEFKTVTVSAITIPSLVTGDGTSSNPYQVSNGNDLDTLLRTSSSGSTIYITVTKNITMGTSSTLPTNLTVVLDMAGNAMYFTSRTNSAPFVMSNGDNITFQNESSISTDTSTSLVGPNASGTGNATVYYNSYYGIFESNSGITGSSLTYRNVVQDFGTISNWIGAGQPFYNYGQVVNFSGTNYFNYVGSGQEFMEGNGINVTDGSTTIIYNTSGTIIRPGSSGKPTINVNPGASLDMTSASSGYGFWYDIGGTPLTITNNGIMNLSFTPTSSRDYYGGYTPSKITMEYGANSQTNINGPGFFNYNATSGSFSTLIGSEAKFTYNTGDTTKAFTGSPASTDSFVISGAKTVRFNTLNTSGGILGTDNSAMPIHLDATAPSGYQINGYDSSGSNTITGSYATGAFGDTGIFHGSLTDLSNLTGVKVATSSEIKIYQAASQLEFNLVSPAQANFTYVWASDTPGTGANSGRLMNQIPLPSNTLVEQGVVGEIISTPTITNPPAGYYLTVKGPNGTIYGSVSDPNGLAEALADNAKYSETSNFDSPENYISGMNDFQLIWNASPQIFYINFSYIFNNYGVEPNYPAIQSYLGLTGEDLSPILPTPPKGYHFSGIGSLVDNYWVDINNPETGEELSSKGGFYNDIVEALDSQITSDNSGMYFGVSSLSTPPSNGVLSPSHTNVSTVLITANKETAHYNYQWAVDTPIYIGQPALPNNVVSSGGYGDKISFTGTNTAIGNNGSNNGYSTFVSPPSDQYINGYNVSVSAPNGVTYTNDPTAEVSDTVVKSNTPLKTATESSFFEEGTDVNNFEITYSPVLNTVTWHYIYEPGMINPPPSPEDNVQNNLKTGVALSDPGLSTGVPEGYYIDGYQYPGDSKVYMSVDDLKIAHPNVTNTVIITVLLVKDLALPYTGGGGMSSLIVVALIFAILGIILHNKKLNTNKIL